MIEAFDHRVTVGRLSVHSDLYQLPLSVRISICDGTAAKPKEIISIHTHASVRGRPALQVTNEGVGGGQSRPYFAKINPW